MDRDPDLLPVFLPPHIRIIVATDNGIGTYKNGDHIKRDWKILAIKEVERKIPDPPLQRISVGISPAVVLLVGAAGILVLHWGWGSVLAFGVVYWMGQRIAHNTKRELGRRRSAASAPSSGASSAGGPALTVGPKRTSS
jgi:hypothetical protein